MANKPNNLVYPGYPRVNRGDGQADRHGSQPGIPYVSEGADNSLMGPAQTVPSRSGASSHANPILTPVTEHPDTGRRPWRPHTSKKSTDFFGCMSIAVQQGTMQGSFDHSWPFIYSLRGFQTVNKHFLLTNAIWLCRSYLFVVSILLYCLIILALFWLDFDDYFLV